MGSPLPRPRSAGRAALSVLKPCARVGCGVLVPAGTGRCEDHALADLRAQRAAVDAARAGRPSRRWYASSRWKRKRAAQMRAEPLCRYCLEGGVTRLASVADHVQPHREDAGLFWGGALQSLCVPCHSGRKQREEAQAAAR